MIIQANAADFAALLSSRAPRGLRLVPDSVIAPLEVLQMLGDLAARIALSFEPSAWLVVENDEVVGLCSAVRVPTDGELIGSDTDPDDGPVVCWELCLT
jgi:hypothetical protein